MQLPLKMTRITGPLHADLSIFMISRSILLSIRNVSDKSCREKQNIFMFNNFFSENHVVYEIMWKNMVQTGQR